MGEQIQKRAGSSPAKERPSGTFWKICGSTALVLAVAGLLISLPDIKRYIKISTM